MNEISPEQVELLKQARRANLLKAWAAGRRKLSREELEEIRHLLPAGTVAEEAPPESPGGRHRLPFAKRLPEYQATYETKVRQIKRWIAAGREASPPELPPLDEPGKMADWWARNMKHRVPPKIAALAVTQPPPIPEPGAPTTNPVVAGMDLASFSTQEGEILKQARRLASGTYEKLSLAYSAGDDAAIRLWQPRWEKANEAVRRAEKDDREEQRRRGELIPISQATADIAQLLEMLRSMRGTMPRRILARLDDLPAEITERIARAIETEREKEDVVLRQLPNELMKLPIELRDPSHVEFELAS